MLEENIFCQQGAIQSKNHPGHENIEATVHNCDTNEKNRNGIAIYHTDHSVLCISR